MENQIPKIECESMEEDFSLPRTLSNGTIVDFYNDEEKPEVRINGTIYTLEEARELKKLLNEYI